MRTPPNSLPWPSCVDGGGGEDVRRDELDESGNGAEHGCSMAYVNERAEGKMVTVGRGTQVGRNGKKRNDMFFRWY